MAFVQLQKQNLFKEIGIVFLKPIAAKFRNDKQGMT